MTTKHSNLGPSSAKRWIACPGSVAACAKVPAQPSTIFSAEGTVAHDICEQHVTNQLTHKQLMSLVGTVVEQDGFSITIDEEMVNAAADYREIIETDTADMGKGAVGKAEVRVKASSVDDAVYGTADYILYRKGHALRVYDFKYGRGVAVSPEQNEQMAIYALGAIDTESGDKFKTIELVIIQPRAGGDSVRRWEVPTGWIEAFRTDLKESVSATRKENARLTAGDHCRWCAAKPTCIAAHAEVQKRAMVDFAKPVPALPDVGTLPLEKLTAALEYEEFINGWFEAAKVRIRALLDSGEAVPGYKLVEGRSTRKWCDEAAVVEEFSGTLGEAALFEKKLISPAKLEKVVGKGKIDHLTYKPEGTKAIARDDDPRPAAKRSAVEDFAVIEGPKTSDELDILLGLK